jgi:hypothetical protein
LRLKRRSLEALKGIGELQTEPAADEGTAAAEEDAAGNATAEASEDEVGVLAPTCTSVRSFAFREFNWMISLNARKQCSLA